MTRKELRKLVREEADKLKLNAGNAEISRLDFKTLQPDYAASCIYGQMTGDCFSKRSHHLLETCAVPVSRGLPYGDIKNEQVRSSFELGDDVWAGRDVSRKYFSAIELYIAQPWAKGDNLIAYLRGETRKLDI